MLACDIPFVHRFLYDKGIGLTVTFDAEEEPPEVRAQYTVPDVVKVVTSERDIRPAEPFRPSLRVLSFDIENAIRARTIFTICGVAEGGGKERRTFRFTDPDERRILEKFVDIIADDDPDVITGYNIGGYDFPLMVERAKATGLGDLKFGRDRAPPSEAGERLWKVHGRVVADAWWSARRELKPKQETLQFVGARSSTTRNWTSTAVGSTKSGRGTRPGSWSTASTTPTSRSASCNACGRWRRPPTWQRSPGSRSRRG